MNKCHKYDNIFFNEGILDTFIDAVYVILLKGSYRTKGVYNQINNYKLSKKNHIQINEKFSDCYNKELCDQKTYYHLTDNTVNILKDANNRNYNNILVFEDDFILDEQIKEKKIIGDLSAFMNNNSFDIYFLGCMPWIISPHDSKHMKIYGMGATHSVIYSKQGRDKIIKKYEKNKCIFPFFHDLWYNKFLSSKYMYYKPLCYQPLVETNNRNEWSNFLLNEFLHYLELDTNPVFGFRRYYLIIYFLNIVVFLTLLYFLIKQII